MAWPTLVAWGGPSHEILGIKPDATPREIKKAYHRRMRELRPEIRPETTEEARKVIEAYKHLTGGGEAGEPGDLKSVFDRVFPKAESMPAGADAIREVYRAQLAADPKLLAQVLLYSADDAVENLLISPPEADRVRAIQAELLREVAATRASKAARGGMMDLAFESTVTRGLAGFDEGVSKRASHVIEELRLYSYGITEAYIRHICAGTQVSGEMMRYFKLNPGQVLNRDIARALVRIPRKDLGFGPLLLHTLETYGAKEDPQVLEILKPFLDDTSPPLARSIVGRFYVESGADFAAGAKAVLAGSEPSSSFARERFENLASLLPRLTEDASSRSELEQARAVLLRWIESRAVAKQERAQAAIALIETSRRVPRWGASARAAEGAILADMKGPMSLGDQKILRELMNRGILREEATSRYLRLLKSKFPLDMLSETLLEVRDVPPEVIAVLQDRLPTIADTETRKKIEGHLQALLEKDPTLRARSGRITRGLERSRCDLGKQLGQVLHKP